MPKSLSSPRAIHWPKPRPGRPYTPTIARSGLPLQTYEMPCDLPFRSRLNSGSFCPIFQVTVRQFPNYCKNQRKTGCCGGAAVWGRGNKKARQRPILGNWRVVQGFGTIPFFGMWCRFLLQSEQGIGISTTSAPRRVRIVQTRSSLVITGASTALSPSSLRWSTSTSAATVSS